MRLLRVLAAVLSVASCGASWPNSSTGFHPFLTFDSGLNASEITAAAPSIQFVWGGHAPRAWRAASANHTIVSSYMPFNRDPNASHSLAWWRTAHPAWVLYSCDRVTPARVDPADANIALDVSNPEVVAWQLEFSAAQGAQGFGAIAADNFEPANFEGACGVWRGAAWVQLYKGTQQDPAYTAAMLAWLAAFRAGLRALAPPMLLVPNFAIAGLPFDSPTAAAVLAGADGVLDERGFTGWGTGLLGAGELANVVSWARALQRAGKAFFSINEWRAGGSGGGAQPPPLPPRAVLEFVAAGWLMANEGASGLFSACVQCYGWWQAAPQYALRVGAPLGPASVTGGAWTRTLGNGFAAVNPAGAPTARVALPAGAFVNAYGDAFTGSVDLEGGAGIVLVRA
jgi:hypothetical protein